MSAERLASHSFGCTVQSSSSVRPTFPAFAFPHGEFQFAMLCDAKILRINKYSKGPASGKTSAIELKTYAILKHIRLAALNYSELLCN